MRDENCPLLGYGELSFDVTRRQFNELQDLLEISTEIIRESGKLMIQFRSLSAEVKAMGDQIMLFHFRSASITGK